MEKKYTRPAIAIKHKKVLDNLVENGGNLSQAIRATNLYSEVVANDPGKITNSVTWKELMEEHIPDSLLAEKHKALLNKVDKEGEIDVTAVSKALDLAYKVKGKVTPEPPKNEGGNTYNFIFNKEIQADLREIENRIKAQLLNDKEN